MKHLFFSMLLSAGLFVYFSTTAHVELTESAPRAPAQQMEPEAAERIVQIQGKFYKYRPDNRYVIDGVPTFHVPKKQDVKTVEAQPAPRMPANDNLDKSQKLVKLAMENPTAIYTPEGMKMLKEGLEAAQKSAADRKKAMDELTKD